jgi:hypothetical protein
MNIKHLSVGGGLIGLALMLGVAAPAGATDDPYAAAIKACSSANGNPSAKLVTVIDDGRGGSLVWLTDAKSGLWLCNADAQGNVYVYNPIGGDLLNGKGAGLVHIDHVVGEDGMPLPERNPIDVAEQVCVAYLPGEETKVVGSGLDGLSEDWVAGYYVFVAAGNDKLYLCDATGDAAVWAFSEISDPLDLGNQVG